jgi:hypothetical protein
MCGRVGVQLTRARAAVAPEKGDIVDAYSDFASATYAPVTRDGKFTDGSAVRLHTHTSPKGLNLRELGAHTDLLCILLRLIYFAFI